MVISPVLEINIIDTKRSNPEMINGEKEMRCNAQPNNQPTTNK